MEKLRNIEERDTHFVGWMHFKHKDMSIIDFMQNWLWLYTHHTRTVYVKRIDWTSFKSDSCSYDKDKDEKGDAGDGDAGDSSTRSKRLAAWSARPLRFEPWALDGRCDGKFVKQIGFQRFDCSPRWARTRRSSASRARSPVLLVYDTQDGSSKR